MFNHYSVFLSIVPREWNTTTHHSYRSVKGYSITSQIKKHNLLILMSYLHGIQINN